MKNTDNIFFQYRQLSIITALAACLLLSGGCARMQFLGSIVTAEFAKAPASERSVASIDNREIPGPAAPIPVRIYTPAGAGPFPVLVYFHGGGWTSGSPFMYDPLCRFLCNRASCIVLSVDYRLAPQHTFPAAFDDAYAAALWAQKNSEHLNSDPEHIAVAGDSAGGNLAAAVALASRDRREPKLVLQILAFAATDLASLATDSYRQNNGVAGLTLETVIACRDQYLADPADRLNQHVSPLRAPDHRGLPPALIIVGTLDIVRDDGLQYAAKLAAGGVPARVVQLAGQGHAVVPWARASQKARPALDAAVQALQEAFYGTPATADRVKPVISAAVEKIPWRHFQHPHE